LAIGVEKNWGRVHIYLGVDEAIANPNNMNLKFKIKGLLLSDLKDLQFKGLRHESGVNYEARDSQ
jgi:hypothetical protein